MQKLMGVEYKRADATDGETVHTITVTTRPRPSEEGEAGRSDYGPLYGGLAMALQNAAGIFAGLADAPPERACKVVPPDGRVVPFGLVDPPDGRAS